MSKVAPSRIATWLASYDFGAASFNLYLEFIRAVFALAVQDRLLPASPVDGIKSKRAAKPIRQTPTPEEFWAIVADIRAQVYNANAKDNADFVEFIGLAGLGQAEAGSLTWSDMDWQKGLIKTFRHKTSRGFLVPIFPQLRPLLQWLRQDRGGAPAASDRVFRIKNAKHALSAACKRLEMPAYSHRAFRRMFITRAIERGVDVKIIAGWQGHQDGGWLILSAYSHLRPLHSDTMAKLIERGNCFSFLQKAGPAMPPMPSGCRRPDRCRRPCGRAGMRRGSLPGSASAIRECSRRRGPLHGISTLLSNPGLAPRRAGHPHARAGALPLHRKAAGRQSPGQTSTNQPRVPAQK